MIYSIENEFIKISVDTNGAQLMSYYSKKTNTEYLWQGEPEFWTGRAYNLFPVIGRMVDGIYTYKGKTYSIRAHGIARYYEFTLEECSDNKIAMVLKDNEDTFKEYPFHFTFRVIFTIDGYALKTTYEVKNHGDDTLISSFGGHPGINIPFEKGKGEFEDYYLEFSKPTQTKRQLLWERTFMAEKSEPFELVDGKKIPLYHELFVDDAVILENTSYCVSVKSKTDPRYVTMHYEDFPFIGFWQTDKPGAPYVCLEPWGSLPATAHTVTDLETKKYMSHVAPNETASASFTMEIHE